MQNIRQALTAEQLHMLATIADSGSLAAAAEALGIVPSALSYRLRQLEDAVDALLVLRSRKRSALTPAGAELLRVGAPLLSEMDALARRIQRIASGWEPELVLVADALIDTTVLLDLVADFDAEQAPTQLRLLQGTLSGTMESLMDGEADIAIGVLADQAHYAGIATFPLGDMPFVFAVAPEHPLAAEPEPISDETRARHRAVAAADSSRRRGASVGLLSGQAVLSVPDMRSKMQAQLAGLGCGFLPEPWARAAIAQGRLVVKALTAPPRVAPLAIAWRDRGPSSARAMQWWLRALKAPRTRAALLGQAR
jgi:DNA-binding transcriptional LysR family regulator